MQRLLQVFDGLGQKPHHAKGGHILFIVYKHGHGPIEVGHAPILFAECEKWGDVRDALGEDWQLDLWHRL